jgi:hypothetical protein
VDTTQPKTHRLTRKQIKRYLFLLIGVILFGIIAWNAFLFIRPQARIDFTVYKPAKLPNGYQLQDNRLIQIWHARLWLGIGAYIDSPFPDEVFVSQDLGTHKAITQEKDPGDAYLCGPEHKYATCKVKKTAAGQQYRLDIDTYSPPDKTAKEYAVFVKGNTQITLHVVASTDHPVSDADWSTIIDSLQPTSIDGTPARYFYPGP